MISQEMLKKNLQWYGYNTSFYLELDIQSNTIKGYPNVDRLTYY